jgi:hypothetical protein
MLYRIRPGKSMDQYRKYSREVDQKIWREEILGKIPGIKSFKVYEVKGGNPKPPYDIIEDLEVDNLEAWERFQKSSVTEKTGPPWREISDEASMYLAYAEQIPP